MNENSQISSPINLNCWKHHVGFIRKRIESVREIEELEDLKKHLLTIGESQMDLYFGKHSPQNISDQILSTLHQNKSFEFEQYKNWLTKEGKNYQLIKFKDKSIWTLRQGDDISRYVHIHPGRYSPHTVRVKATTLKTAILVLCSEKIGEIKTIETQTINQIRKKYLDEPPIKSYSNASGLGRLIDLLHKKQGVKIAR